MQRHDNVGGPGPAGGGSFAPNPYGPGGGQGRAGIPGSFAGRGPRGYRRTDDRVREEICERLTEHPLLDASDVDVEVRDGVVTLTGRVAVRAEKHLAEDIAEEVWGVNDVENRLRVQRDPTPLIGGQQRPSGGRDWDAQPARVGPGQLRPGMDVLDADGDSIGRVKEVHARDFLVDRPRVRDIYVPYAAVRHTSGDRVELMVTGREVDAQGWPYPEILGVRNAGYSIP